MFSFLFIIFSLFSLSLGVYVFLGSFYVIEFYTPFMGLVDLSLSFCFDHVSLVFFSVVSLISGCVFMYSKYYMEVSSDSNSDLVRFFWLLFLFVLSMFFLVFSFSWVSVILGWDGLGLVSFLLVVYYNNPSSLISGLVTVFMNRVGDCFFIMSFAFMFYCGWACYDYMSFSSCVFFSFFLFLGTITKSAQLPFSSWLPMAMAAPTPVSSLVHSSTLVTAGVYLLVRFNYLLEGVFVYLSFVSLFTMSLAGLCASVEADFKKVVAMSTLSQLGFMVFTFSCGYWLLCYYHMVFHAFFKSILFLSTGSLMHLVGGSQEFRLFGGFFSSFYSKVFFTMSCLSLMGFPFSLGFYSKDLILGGMLLGLGGLPMFLFLVSCCFTVSYSLRLLSMGFLGYPSMCPVVSYGEGLYFYLPVLFLFGGCVFSGNFFFISFLPSYSFSFWECSVGLVVIVVGFVFYYFASYSYFFINLLMSMSFLSLLSSSFFSKGFSLMDKLGDYTWGEVVGARGVSSYLMFVDDKGSGLWMSLFSSLVLLFVILLSLVMMIF